MKDREFYKITLVGLLLTMCFLITWYCHFILKTEIVFTHLFYVPIILAGLWWSHKKGIAVAVFLALLLLLSHIISPLKTPWGADIVRAFMFMVIGTTVGILSEKERILKDKTLAYSKTLEQRVKERMDELSKEKEKQKTILNSISDAVVVLDKELNITWANQVAMKQYGALSGRKCHEIYKWLKEPCSGCVARKTYKNGVARSIEQKGISGDGNPFNFIISCSAVSDTDGKVVSVVEVFHDITERKLAEEKIKNSLHEKELLLKEVHHRVKNNLQVISSLLDLSSMRTQDKKAISLFTDARSKIQTMALIHSQIYQSERFDRIDMGSHIKDLVSYLSSVYADRKKVNAVVEILDIYLSITQAIPCALVLNELISNAFKHAFMEGQKGTITVSMQSPDKEMIFARIKDDGTSIPEEIDIYKANTLGLKLTRNIVQQQLDGKIQVRRDKGTEFIIEFKKVGGGIVNDA